MAKLLILLFLSLTLSYNSNIDICKINKINEKYFDYLANCSNEWLCEDDKCVLKLLDLIKKDISIGNDRNLIILDSVTNHSDGYISEALSEIMFDLYKNKNEIINKYFENMTINDFKKNKLKLHVKHGIEINGYISNKSNSRLDLYLKD